MSIPLGSPGPIGPAPTLPKKRRSALGRVFHGVGWLAAGPVDWVGARRINWTWSLIRDLIATLRAGSQRDRGFKPGGDGSFDLEAVAFAYNQPVYVVRARLDARQRQTARIAYTMLALAGLFLLGWVWRAFSSPWSAVRLASAVNFLPFCALFLLTAFYNALLNFQIRIGRLASWREYLMTNQPFWPR